MKVDQAMRLAGLAALVWIGYELHQLRRESNNTFPSEQATADTARDVAEIRRLLELAAPPREPYAGPTSDSLKRYDQLLDIARGRASAGRASAPR